MPPGSACPPSIALISLLTLNGPRVSEATGGDTKHLGTERGHRTLVIARKGGKVVTINDMQNDHPVVDRQPTTVLGDDKIELAVETSVKALQFGEASCRNTTRNVFFLKSWTSLNQANDLNSEFTWATLRRTPGVSFSEGGQDESG